MNMETFPDASHPDLGKYNVNASGVYGEGWNRHGTHLYRLHRSLRDRDVIVWQIKSLRTLMRAGPLLSDD